MNKSVIFIFAMVAVTIAALAWMASATSVTATGNGQTVNLIQNGVAAANSAPSPVRSANLAAPSAGSCGMGGGCGCGGMRAAPSPSAAPVAPAAPAQIGSTGAQVVSVRAQNSGGYDHPSLQVKAGQPVEFHFSADSNVGCGRQLILDGLNVNLVSQSGEDEVATFTPTTPGTYAYHCGMNMFRGSLQVV